MRLTPWRAVFVLCLVSGLVALMFVVMNAWRTDSARTLAELPGLAGTSDHREEEDGADTTTLEPADAPPLPITKGTLDREGSIGGRVVGEGGAGIAGARVQAIRYDGRWIATPRERERPVELIASCLTAVDGSFAMEVAWGDVVNLRVSARGYATRSFSRAAAGEWVEIMLEPAAVVAVHAVDEDGAPVEDLRVEIWSRIRPDRQALHREHLVGFTNSEGDVVLANVPSGPSVMICEHPVLARHSDLIDVEASERTVVDVVMARGRTVRGRVIDRDSGEGIEGAAITSIYPPTNEARVVTDGGGEFAFRGLPESHRYLHVYAEDYAPATVWVKDLPEREQIEVRLDRGYSVRGVVLDAQGPIEGALVNVLGCRGRMKTYEIDGRAGRSDANGEFIVHGLDRELEYGLTVRAKDHDEFSRTLYGPDEGDEELGEIFLDEGFRVSGIVVDVNYEPLRDATVTLHRAGRPSGGCHAEGEERRTDDLGRFRFDDVGSGSYRVSVQYDQAEPKREWIHVREADSMDNVFVLGWGKTLRVRTVDENGVPVPGIRWSASWRIGGSAGKLVIRAGTSDTDGEVRLQGLPAREVSLDARVPDGFQRPRGLRVVPTEEWIDVRVERIETIEGFVAWAHGGPASGLRVSATSADRQRKVGSATTDVDGSFRITCAASSGPVDLGIGSPRGAGASDQEVVLVDPPTWIELPAAGLVLTAERRTLDAELLIRVVDPAGRPCPRALIAVRSRARGTERLVEAGGDGWILAGELADDRRYELQAFPTPGEALLVPSAIREAHPSDGEVTLTLREAFRVTGRVRDQNGGAMPGVWVRAVGPQGAVARVIAGDRGQFELDLPAGEEYRLEITADRDGTTVLALQAPALVVAQTDRLELIVTD